MFAAVGAYRGAPIQQPKIFDANTGKRLDLTEYKQVLLSNEEQKALEAQKNNPNICRVYRTQPTIPILSDDEISTLESKRIEMISTAVRNLLGDFANEMMAPKSANSKSVLIKIGKIDGTVRPQQLLEQALEKTKKIEYISAVENFVTEYVARRLTNELMKDFEKDKANKDKSVLGILMQQLDLNILNIKELPYKIAKLPHVIAASHSGSHSLLIDPATHALFTKVVTNKEWRQKYLFDKQ